MKNDVLADWDVDYNGCAIYSLVDNKNKRYIGQSTALRSRLKEHHYQLNRASKHEDAEVTENKKLVDAVRSGETFRVEVLKIMPLLESNINNLRYWEKHYLEKYGGLENTYNSAPIPLPDWNYHPMNDILLTIDIADKDILARLDEVDNIQGYIKRLIRQDIAKG